MRLRSTERLRETQRLQSERQSCNPLATATPPPGGFTGWQEGDATSGSSTCGFNWGNTCNWGDNNGQGDAMLDRLQAECPSTRHPTPLRDLGFLMVGPYAETTFFQELANRTVRATTCQIQILDPAQRQPLVNAAWEVFQEIQPLMQILVQRRSEAQREYDSWALAAADRSGMDARRRRSELQEQIAQINTGIDDLLSQLPFGAQEPVKEALHGYAGRGISAAQFANAYNGALNATKTTFEDASCTYQSIRNPRSGVYRLSDDQKIALYHAPGTSAMINRIDPGGNGLSCQLYRCFESGPRNAQFVAIGALIGVTILSAGTASPFVGAVATAGALTFSATQIERACGRPTTTATAENITTCSAAEMARLTVDQISRVGCATEIALGSLDLLPGVAGARNLLRARRLARAGDAAEAARAAELAQAASITARTDNIISGSIRIGGEVAEEGTGAVIRVTGSVSREGRSVRVAGRLERGEDASALFEGLGYSRVLDSPAGTVAFRNARGEQIVLANSGRLSTREANRVAAILERGRGSYTAAGVSDELTAAAARARTLADSVGADKAAIIGRVDVANADSLDDALIDLYRLRPGQAQITELNALQRIQMLDELEAGLRIRDPRILQSPEFLAARQRAQRNLVTFSARASEDAENLALGLQDVLTRTSPAGRSADDYRLIVSGRADEVIARTPGIAVEDANRIRALQDRIADARRTLGEIPGVRIPDSIRIVDDIPDAARVIAGADDSRALSRVPLPDADVRALQQSGLRDLLERSSNRTVSLGSDAAAERRILLEDLNAVFTRWGSKKEEVFRFLNNSSPALTTAEKERYFAILINSEGDVSAVITRLQRVRAGGAGRAQVFATMDDQILNLSRQIQTGFENGADVRLLAEQRSALTLERNLLEFGDDLEISRIFPARAHNDASAARLDEAGNPTGEQGRHSLDGSFSLDVRARTGSDISVCRGSYATAGAFSGLSGGFFTFCRSGAYLDRPVIGTVVAAPADASIDVTLQGYTRFNRFQLTPGTEFSLGRNGPVTYTNTGVTNGTGGPGGGIEFFVSRNGNRLNLDDLRASVRTPSCVRSAANPLCDRIFRIQEILRPGTLRRGVAPDTIAIASDQIDDLLVELAPQIDRYMASVRAAPDSATLNRLRSEYPEVVSALNLRRELELKSRIGFTPRACPTCDLDGDTAALINFERSAGEFDGSGVRFQRIRTSGGGDASRTREAFVREISTAPVVVAYREAGTELARLNTQLRTATNLTPTARADLLYQINTLGARMDDMRLASNSVGYRMRSAVGRLNLPQGEADSILAEITRVLPRGD